jgi:hypothetical protein
VVKNSKLKTKNGELDGNVGIINKQKESIKKALIVIEGY